MSLEIKSLFVKQLGGSLNQILLSSPISLNKIQSQRNAIGRTSSSVISDKVVP